MENKLPNVKSRILYLVKNQGFKYEIFFPKIGMSYGNFKGNAKNTPINSDALAKILSFFPAVNLRWLLTGEGEMLINDEVSSSSNKRGDDYTALQKVLIESQKKQIEHLESECKRLKMLISNNDI